MTRPLRDYAAHGTYFVTVRTLHGRMLLRPSATTNALVGGILARAALLYGVQIHAFHVASNHLHLLSTTRDGRLSAFMQYVCSNVARKVGRTVRWRERFWSRRFSAEPVLDDEAMVKCLRYILAHGVKEGLVRHVADWPGLHCAEQVGSPGTELEFAL